jgi:hypothetical protein
MKADDLDRLEAAVRDANPVPQSDALVDSEESAAVTFSLIEATEKDVPGLLPVPPEVAHRERGVTMETVQSFPARETKRPRPVRAAAIAFAAAVFVAALIGIGAVITRDSTGEVASPAPVAPPEITFDDPERQLFTYEQTIRQLIEDTHAQAAPLLDVEGIAFVVSLEVYGLAIPDYGIGWRPADDNTVVIGIDPYFPQLSEVLPERVPVVVADALFGAARSRGGVVEETFFDTMVWSGLAANFTVELLGVPPPPWANAFPAEQTETFLEQARPLYDTRWDDELNLELSTAERLAATNTLATWFDWDRMQWREEGIDPPQWAGQTLGYRLMEAYLADNPDQTAADLVNTPASVFRP